jgi:glycosyltransferase involved in cell wall biosynthesis
MSITVLVPTYQRSNDLRRCLDALQRQTLAPDEVIVVFRPEDLETQQLLDHPSGNLFLRKIAVDEPGQIAALEKGLNEARGDIIAITDDDAAPHPRWLERIEGHFARNAMIGAVGGRDCIYREGQLFDEKKSRVGTVQWFGRTIGNHHAGFGDARDVEILKGANMSYRRQAISGLSFDRRLRGRGAEACNDMGFSLSVRRRGWRVIYDPAVSVDHYPTMRPDGMAMAIDHYPTMRPDGMAVATASCRGGGRGYDIDQHNLFNAVAVSDAVHNETLVLLDYLPPTRRIIFLVWALLVGPRGGPGLAQWVRFLMKGDRKISANLRAAFKGRLEGYKTWARSVKPIFLG